MPKAELVNVIDCSVLTAGEINLKISDCILGETKQIILQNAKNKTHLLSSLTGNIKIEVFDDTGDEFANSINNLKIIVYGNIGKNSAQGILKSKVTVFGSCKEDFARNANLSEFYILKNCKGNSFLNLKNSKVVIGESLDGNIASGSQDSILLILNLDKRMFNVSRDWFKDLNNGHFFIRGDETQECFKKYDFLFNETCETDEDVILPLISEFARLFKYSLGEIKSKPFYRINLAKETRK